MNESKQIDELMHRWEEARKNGVLLTAEDLCGDCPELTEKIRERLQAIATMELVLGVEQAETLHDPQTPPEDLPSVPGYEIIRVIDRGGMGVVFEARQIGLDRIVALKMLPGMAASPKAVARFCSEAELAARLHHPNIVQIFEVGKIGAQPFFSMELVRGGNLAQLLESRELTVQESASMIETVAKAVHLAHQAAFRGSQTLASPSGWTPKTVTPTPVRFSEPLRTWPLNRRRVAIRTLVR